MNKKIYLTGAVLLAAVVCLWDPAYAALGGVPGSTRAALSQVKYESPPGHNPLPWDVKRFVSPQDEEVREYIANRRVFGVSWKGPEAPNMKALLGNYYQEWRAHHGPGFHFENGKGFVVETGESHGGYVRGRAWLEQLAPPTVSPPDIVW